MHSLKIHDIPDDVWDVLQARAAEKGVEVEEIVRARLAEWGRTATSAELVEWARHRVAERGGDSREEVLNALRASSEGR